MKTRKMHCFWIILVASLVGLGIQGCGRHKAFSVVSGTVSDMNQNVLVDARVYCAGLETRSLVSGAYRLEDIPSGLRTIRAEASIQGQTWIGSTAVEVLRNEPTMNVNIILAPVSETTSIYGTVIDDTGRPVRDARVFVFLKPPGEGESGPYGSIAAITDWRGRYELEDVPVGVPAKVAASKVGFRNDEIEIAEIKPGISPLNFELSEIDLSGRPRSPTLDWIESWTMPDSITRSIDAFEAIRAFTSPRYRAVLAKRRTTLTKATPLGSLIEIDLYWSDPNSSSIIAGYGIYRGTTTPLKAIDFVRDTYANFYGDMGTEITPGVRYYYAVTAVNMEFLDEFNQPNPYAESNLSNMLDVRPMDQLYAIAPAHGAVTSTRPTFTWKALSGAEKYSVYVYDRFPTLPLDPSADYGMDPSQYVGVYPIWPTRSDPNGSTVFKPSNSIVYSGPTLERAHTYYWVVLAQDASGHAYTYSDLRPFTVE